MKPSTKRVFLYKKMSYFCLVAKGKVNRALGVQRNKLLFYKNIKEMYQKAIQEHPYTPTTKILEFYIYPTYPISRTTLYTILTTSVTSELRKIEEAINAQTTLRL